MGKIRKNKNRNQFDEDDDVNDDNINDIINIIVYFDNLQNYCYGYFFTDDNIISFVV